jgi:hypothetical protein
MSDPEAIVVPKLTPETVRVFMASGDAETRAEAAASLRKFGIGCCSIKTAVNYQQARDIVFDQVPGQLSANVWLFDGEIDNSEPGGVRQGNRLMSVLLSKYCSPVIAETLREATLQGEELGGVIDREAVKAMAAQRLGADALLVGISKNPDGALGYPAQIPLTPLDEVGRVVSEMVIPIAA